MPRKDVDWTKIESDYRAGILSVREIAREANLSEGAVRKRAKANGWERDLTEQVRAKTRQKLVESLANTHDSTQASACAEETTERAALTQVAVVRDHQVSVHEGYSITRRLLDELNATTSHQGEMETLITAIYDDGRQKTAAMRAVSLPGRAAVMRDLAQAAKVWVAMERQAFGIWDDSKTPPPPKPQAIENLTAAELRQSIIDDIERLGIGSNVVQFPTAPSPEGVANRPVKNGNGTTH